MIEESRNIFRDAKVLLQEMHKNGRWEHMDMEDAAYYLITLEPKYYSDDDPLKRFESGDQTRDYLPQQFRVSIAN